MIEQMIKDKLHTNVLKVTFTKVDGSTRVMKCTLKEDLVPQTQKTTTDKAVTRVPAPGLISCFDIEAQGWRSFKVANLLDWNIENETEEQTSPPNPTAL